jgi:transcriptional regulator with XRE-family HTH domain
MNFYWRGQGMSKEQFAKDFAMKRAELNLNQDQLADRLGVSATSIQNYESPTKKAFPRSHRWAKIKDLMGIDVMPYKYENSTVSFSGDRSSGHINASGSSNVSVGGNYGQGNVGKYAVELSQEEYDILMKYRGIGSPSKIIEKCMAKISAIEAMIG